MAKPVKREEKKPYSKPMLTVYGTITDLTLRTGPNGKKDKAGVRPPAHTHA
jgi:hypothetical protein